MAGRVPRSLRSIPEDLEGVLEGSQAGGYLVVEGLGAAVAIHQLIARPKAVHLVMHPTKGFIQAVLFRVRQIHI